MLAETAQEKNQGKRSRLAAGFIDAFFVVLIWSGFILVSRIGGKSPLLPYDVVALRFGTAAACILPFWIFFNKVRLLDVRLIGITLIGGIGYCTFAYYGFKHAPAVHAGILLPGMLPFEAAVMSWLVLGEKPTKRRVLALCVIALGVVALGVDIMRGGFSTLDGDLAFLAAGTCWALYAALVRKWHIAPWDTVVALALISAAIYLPVYWLLLPRQLAEASWNVILFQAFYQGVMAMIVAMILYMRAMKFLGPSKIGLFMSLVPAISGLAAVPLLDESLTAGVIAGIFCVTFGAWLGSRG